MKLKIDTRSIFAFILLGLILVRINAPWYYWVAYIFSLIGVSFNVE